MTQRIAVFPADRHSLYEEHGYSAAIRSGDLLFISGQVGSHTDGTPEPDFQKQVRLALRQLCSLEYADSRHRVTVVPTAKIRPPFCFAVLMISAVACGTS